MQLRFETELSFEQYVSQRAWETATLAACPLCAPGSCRFRRLGTYMRKVPSVAFVARFYCPDQRTTFGVLPDFYASRMPGTLDAIEDAAAYAEMAPSRAKAADDLRPADRQDAVTLDAAVAWLERRITLVRATLVAVLGLFPERFAGCAPRVSAFRARLLPAAPIRRNRRTSEWAVRRRGYRSFFFRGADRLSACLSRQESASMSTQ